MIVPVDLPADLATGVVDRAGVGRGDEVIGVHVDVGVAGLNSIEQGAKWLTGQRAGQILGADHAFSQDTIVPPRNRQGRLQLQLIKVIYYA